LPIKFRNILVLGLLSLLLVIFVPAFVYVLGITTDVVESNAARKMAQAETFFDEKLRFQTEQVMSGTVVLVEDFGFKDAVASGDIATIQSALENHGARIGAEFANLRLQDGRLITSNPDIPFMPSGFDTEDGQLKAEIQLVNQRAFLMVTNQILAPRPIAMVTFGFEIGDRFLARLKAISGLDIALFDTSRQSAYLLDSTLPAGSDAELQRLAASMTGEALTRIALPGGEQLVRLMTPYPDAPVSFALLRSLAAEKEGLRELSRNLLILALGAVGLASFAGLLLARRLTRPLEELSRLANRIAAGDYRGRARQRKIIELNTLSRGINSMQRAIADREKRIEYQMRHDPLTGLPNRLNLQSELAHLMAQRTPVVLMAFDINDLRRINDAYGQDAGDTAICELAGRLQQVFARRASVFRTGGDEFTVVIRDADEVQAMHMARMVSDSMKQPVCIGEDLYQLIELSAGFVCCPEDGSEPEAAMRRAEMSVYRAKQLRAFVLRYDAGSDEQRQRRLRLASDVEYAVERQQLHLLYQPKVAVDNSSHIGAEALLRWEHPELGPISPAEFIPIAEKSGAIRSMTRWVLEQVCQSIAHWSSMGLRIPVSMNVSVEDIRDSALSGDIIARVAELGFEPALLCIEITETMLMEQASAAVEFAQRLRRHNIRVSVDDFGTGHSSLARLRELTVDEIKIDKCFVLGSLADPRDRAIVEATVALAKRLHCTTVAEGVEDQACVDALRSLSCDMLQGFHFSKPLKREAFEQWCVSWRGRRG
jgi:diguanylate cyclase (GGDEF)-like protein